MSLNSNSASKSKQRAELEQLVTAYQENGGTVTRQREDKATIRCRACHHRRYVATRYAMSFGRVCPKCGGEARIEAS